MIVVTGAFGTLGRAVVAELIDRGLTVVAVDLAPVPAGLPPAAEAIGGVDLGDADAVARRYAALAGTHGAITGLVNIAGGFVWEPLAGGSIASFDRMYATNLRSAACSCAAALPHLAPGAAIVNVGAAAALAPGAGMAPYAASKAGVRALTESLAEELRGIPVRVNAILPTILDTPANRADMPAADPAGWVRPAAAARVIAFLLSAESGAITGASIPLSLAG